MKIEIIIIIGLLILVYVLKSKNDTKELKSQTETIEPKEQKDIDLPNVKPTVMPTFLHQYKNCIIEDYKKQFFLIMKPSGEKLEKTFMTLEDAKEEIDIYG